MRPRRDILIDYARVLERIYQPDAFFSRVKHVGRHLRLPPAEGLLPLSLSDFSMLRPVVGTAAQAAVADRALLVGCHRMPRAQPARIQKRHDFDGDVPSHRPICGDGGKGE